MFKKTLGCLVAVGVVLAVIPSMCFALNRADVDAYCAARNATYSTSSQRCVCNSGYTESGGTCVSTGGSSGPSRDYEAERRAQEQAEAERQAEEQRKRDAELEQQRIDAENKRIQEEAAKKAKFIKDRDSTHLRGSTGISITPNKSSSTGFRDALKDTGLRGSSQPAANKEQGKQAAALKQVHCVAAITGFALTALENGDNQEFDTLIREASTKFDGGRPNVECPAAPSMPDLKNSKVNMEQLQGKQKQILERAGKLAERMKQTEGKKQEAQPATQIPANETDLEKTVRVQKELNKKNSEKVYGTQQEINQKEKDRKELTKLILENNKLTTSIEFDASTEPPSPIQN